MRGFYRNGYYGVGRDDTGNHSLASSSLPPDPSTIPIVSPGNTDR
jgi:hypothetical protein